MSRAGRAAGLAALAAMAVLAGAAHAATARAEVAARLPGPAFPSFAFAAQVERACDQGLAEARQRVKALERRKVDAGWLAASDALTGRIEDLSYPIDFLQYVHPDAELRDAAQACAVRWQDFGSTLGQNETLYRATKRTPVRDEIDRQVVREALFGFEDAGMSLPAGRRPEAKRLADHIAELGLAFEKNVRADDTRVAFSPDELAGVPAAVWKDAPRDDAQRVLLGLAAPVYDPVMQQAVNPAARERMWRAKQNEGGEANLKLLDEIVKLRREQARLFGFDSFADFKLRRRMAGDTAHVQAFLDEVKAAVGEGEQRDLAALKDAKARHTAQAVEATSLDRWDVAFYEQRLKRQRFEVDQESFRPYFPPQQSLAFVMKIAERLFGVRHTRVAAPAWHPDVQAYVVSDTATGRPLASLFVDLYPREGKFNHAAVWNYRSGSALARRVPQSALVVNFDRQGLTLDELETLLHEFGHALHANLSTTRYAAQSGTSVKLDFVEAPSQMLEDWVYDPKVLALFREVCSECKPVPEAMLAKAKAARDFGRGAQYARQHLYASYDLALHTREAPEPMAQWARMEGATPLGHVAGTRFPAGFAHVATGYAAGYYGYLWSLAVAMDLRSAFADRLDARVGRRYRDIVLANGGQEPPQQLVARFLGREPSNRALFDYLRP